MRLDDAVKCLSPMSTNYTSNCGFCLTDSFLNPNQLPFSSFSTSNLKIKSSPCYIILCKTMCLSTILRTTDAIAFFTLIILVSMSHNLLTRKKIFPSSFFRDSSNQLGVHSRVKTFCLNLFRRPSVISHTWSHFFHRFKVTAVSVKI